MFIYAPTTPSITYDEVILLLKMFKVYRHMNIDKKMSIEKKYRRGLSMLNFVQGSEILLKDIKRA